MKKEMIIFGFLLLIFSINEAKAEPAYSIVMGESPDLKISCFDITNDFCPDTSTCEITIFKPDLGILIDNQSMTYGGTFFYYSLSANETRELGEYSAVVRCEGTTIGSSTFNYEVVEQRGETLLSYSYIIVIIFWVGLIMGLILRQRLLTALMGMGLLIAGIIIINNGFVGYNNNITDIFGMLTLFTGLTFFLKDGIEELENLQI